jgi:uncharacterized protein
MELTAAEGRVLGCLIERAALAPDAYPVSLNALRLACNQGAGRNPVVAYDDRTVEDTLLALKSKGLARFVDPLRGDRAIRYSHRADHRWRMSPAELAVLAVLLVGGPLRLAEIAARARHLHPFESTDEVLAVLDALAARPPSPFAKRLGGRGTGPDALWAEVLTGEPDVRGAGAAGDADEGAGGPSADQRWDRDQQQGSGSAVVVPERVVSAPSYAELAARVSELERRLASAIERPPSRAANDWRPGRSVPLGEAPDERYGGGRPWGEGVAGVPRERALPSPPGQLASIGDLGDLVERLADIERRLARIEAELGALR